MAYPTARIAKCGVRKHPPKEQALKLMKRLKGLEWAIKAMAFGEVRLRNFQNPRAYNKVLTAYGDKVGGKKLQQNHQDAITKLNVLHKRAALVRNKLMEISGQLSNEEKQKINKAINRLVLADILKLAAEETDSVGRALGERQNKVG